MSIAGSGLKYSCYVPKEGETIVANEAYCGECEESVKSVTQAQLIYCRCMNVAVSGAKMYLYRQWIHHENFEDRSIVMLNEKKEQTKPRS